MARDGTMALAEPEPFLTGQSRTASRWVSVATIRRESPWKTTNTPVRMARVSSDDVANSVCLMASRRMARSTTNRDSSLTCGSNGNSSALRPSSL